MLTKKILPIVSVLLTACCITVALIYTVTESSAAALASPSDFLLIDPGHGGPDGGASTADGVLEDDINLEISLILRDMLTVCGYPVRMTRTEDTAIQHTDDAAGRSWKTNDMYNRLELYNAAQLTVSIHQNHFPQAKYSGTQLFYSPNTTESADIAACIREQVISLLQPQNTREMKKAGKNIFLLYQAKHPAVIVECGFLSNPEEAVRMQDSAYQQQMAFAVCCGILQYDP